MSAGDASEFAAHGWAFVPDVLDSETLAEARRRLAAIYPSEEELRSSPDRHQWVADGQFGGLRMWPIGDLLLDLLPVDERIRVVAEQVLGSSDIRLLRAGYQAKYAGTVDFEQVLHYDYPNHSLVVPAENDIIGFFLYLSDVTAELGPTMLVSDQLRGDITPERTHPTPESCPEYYRAEVPAVGPAGSLLAYRSTTYHRGSAMTAGAGVRLTLGFSYARPAPWYGFQSYPRLGEEEGLAAFVAAASPAQRSLIGFPRIGDPYWTAENLERVARRYPGFDPAPYR